MIIRHIASGSAHAYGLTEQCECLQVIMELLQIPLLDLVRQSINESQNPGEGKSDDPQDISARKVSIFLLAAARKLPGYNQPKKVLPIKHCITTLSCF